MTTVTNPQPDATHLGPERVVAFLQGELDQADATAAEDHMDRCPRCLALVAALAKADVVDAPSEPSASTTGADPHAASAAVEDEGRLHRGMTVGRYVVLDEIGSGGMGVVYGAYDPELDRKVALKILRRGSDRTSGQTRLLREAQAMARLSHRNVVAVHDVGTFGAHVFLAMEFVEGMTLRSWVSAEPRSWRQILRMYVFAGRGLAAAHAAGIVHRDFKPTNVLVGHDGRVVVLDFGLARAAADSSSDVGRPQRPVDDTLLATDLTHTDAVVGTPAYMAPEQYDRRPVDARTDQYSFCVSLYEALYGEHPFVSDPKRATATELSTSQLRDVPAGSAVPPRIRRVVVRGLARDADRRHPTMTRLLEGLQRSMGRSKTGWVLAAVGVTAVGLAGVGLGLQPPDPTCTGAAQRLSGVWDEARRAELGALYSDYDAPFAGALWKGARAALDDYAQRWTAQYTDACEATRVRGTQSASHFEARMLCLERRRKEMAAVVDLLARGEPEILARASDVARTLTPIRRCEDLDALLAPASRPTDPASRQQAQRIDGLLARSAAARRAKRLDEAAELSTSALEGAEGLRHPPTLAEALLAVAAVQMDAGELDAAQQTLYRAVWEGQAGGHDHAVARAWNELGWLFAYLRSDPEAARQPIQHGRASIRRLGGDGELEAVRLRNVGWARLKAGRPAEAGPVFQEALALIRSNPHHDRRDVAMLLNALANTDQILGRYEEATARYRDAARIVSGLVGDDHPDTAVIRVNLASVLRLQGRLDEARQELERCLASFLAALGPNHPHVGLTHDHLAKLAGEEGRHADAQRHAEVALKTLRATLEPDHPNLSSVRITLGNAFHEMGQLEAARAQYERALEAQERTVGPDHSSVGFTLSNLAVVVRERDPETARAYDERALAIFRETLGPSHPNVAFCLNGLGLDLLEAGETDAARERFAAAASIAEPLGEPVAAEALTNLGELDLDGGRVADAVDALERALALHRHTPGAALLLADTQFALARALRRRGDADGRDVTLARAALGIYREHGASEAAAATAFLDAPR